MYPHWQYFLTLDSDLDNASRYVEISEKNYKTYSVEFVRILLAAGSEVDVVAKVLSDKLNPPKKHGTIRDYREAITKKRPSFPTMEVALPRHGIDLKPWAEWQTNTNPKWWDSYNDVKHHRDTCFDQANLENTVNAVAGLLVLLCYLYEGQSMMKLSLPKLLSVERYLEGTVWADNLYFGTP